MRIAGVAIIIMSVAVGVVIPATPAAPTPVQSDCSTSGGFGDDQFQLGGECPNEEAPAMGPVASSSSGPTAYWERSYAGGLPDDLEALIARYQPCVTAQQPPPEQAVPPGPSQVCQAMPATMCTTGGRVGLLFQDALLDGRTGGVLGVSAEPVDIAGVPPGTFYGWTGCMPLEELIADPTAGQPPAPPTVEEAWAQVPIEPAVIGTSPTEGVTGMDTWLWADDPGTLAAGPVDLRGWVIEGTASVEEWTWSGADGGDSWSVSSTTPGSEQDPAGEHAYDVKGDYDITVARAWTGSYTVTGYGITYTVADLTYDDDATVAYDVVEVVSVVDDPED